MSITYVDPSKLRHPRTGEQLGVLLTTAQVADIMGEHENTVLTHLDLGLIPSLPRYGKSAPWKIPTARLFRMLGLIEGDADPEAAS